METITFTAGIKKFNIKQADGLPELSIELVAIVGLGKKAQEIVDTMNGPVVVTLTPAQSRLEFGKDEAPEKEEKKNLKNEVRDDLKKKGLLKTRK